MGVEKWQASFEKSPLAFFVDNRVKKRKKMEVECGVFSESHLREGMVDLR